METEQFMKNCLAEAKKIAQELNCNVDLTSVWMFTEDDEIKYMAQTFYGEDTSLCIRGNVEDNWTDAIISFYKNTKAMIEAQNIIYPNSKNENGF